MCELTDGIIFGFLGCCAWSDWKTKEIPVYMLVLFSISTGLLTFSGSGESIESVIGGVLMGLLFFIISKVTEEAIGYGDSWIILLLGIYLGGMKLLWLLFFASFGAGICSLVHMWKHNWKKSESIPFVPFMAVAYLGVMCL